MCTLFVCPCVSLSSDLPSLSLMDTVAAAGDSETPGSEGEESRMVKVSSASPSHKVSSVIEMLVH